MPFSVTLVPPSLLIYPPTTAELIATCEAVVVLTVRGIVPVIKFNFNPSEVSLMLVA